MHRKRVLLNMLFHNELFNEEMQFHTTLSHLKWLVYSRCTEITRHFRVVYLQMDHQNQHVLELFIPKTVFVISWLFFTWKSKRMTNSFLYYILRTLVYFLKMRSVLFKMKIWNVQFASMHLMIFVFASFNFVKSLIPKKHTEIKYLMTKIHNFYFIALLLMRQNVHRQWSK